MSAQGQLYLSDMRDLSESELLLVCRGKRVGSGDQHWNPIPPQPILRVTPMTLAVAAMSTTAEGHR